MSKITPIPMRSGYPRLTAPTLPIRTRCWSLRGCVLPNTQCNGKYGHHTYCSTSHFTEEEIKRAFVSAFNQIFGEKDSLLEDYAIIIDELTNHSQLDGEIAKLQEESEIVMELMRKHIEVNARQLQNQDEYQQRYDTLAARYENTHQQLVTLSAQKQDRIARGKNISRFMEDLENRDSLLTDFDEELWIRMVESITVGSDKNCHFKFKDGSEVDLQIT